MVETQPQRKEPAMIGIPLVVLLAVILWTGHKIVTSPSYDDVARQTRGDR